MKFYWDLQKLIKYAPSYHTAIIMQSTAEMWLKEQAGLIPYLNVCGSQFLPSHWEDIPEINECLVESGF